MSKLLYKETIFESSALFSSIIRIIQLVGLNLITATMITKKQKQKNFLFSSKQFTIDYSLICFLNII